MSSLTAIAVGKRNDQDIPASSRPLARHLLQLESLSVANVASVVFNDQATYFFLALLASPSTRGNGQLILVVQSMILNEFRAGTHLRLFVTDQKQ